MCILGLWSSFLLEAKLSMLLMLMSMQSHLERTSEVPWSIENDVLQIMATHWWPTCPDGYIWL